MSNVQVQNGTEVAASPDRTSSGKAHFEVLDGLRGSAAFLVVAFHIIGIPLGFDDSKNPLHHAYLAVDFFSVYPVSLLEMRTMIDGHA